ncbi:MAG: hypothetical protein V4641_31300 [Pseudomonadota bacterium]
MTTINQLSAADAITAADLFVIYSAANGDARKAAASLLLDFLQSELTNTGSFETQYYNPAATGFSVTVSPSTEGGSVYLLMSPGGAYAAGTIVLPALATCEDGQEVLVSCRQAVTALTVSANGAVAVNGAPTTLAANAYFKLRYDGVTQSWYRVG